MLFAIFPVFHPFPKQVDHVKKLCWYDNTTTKVRYHKTSWCPSSIHNKFTHVHEKKKITSEAMAFCLWLQYVWFTKCTTWPRVMLPHSSTWLVFGQQRMESHLFANCYLDCYKIQVALWSNPALNLLPVVELAQLLIGFTNATFALTWENIATWAWEVPLHRAQFSVDQTNLANLRVVGHVKSIPFFPKSWLDIQNNFIPKKNYLLTYFHLIVIHLHVFVQHVSFYRVIDRCVSLKQFAQKNTDFQNKYLGLSDPPILHICAN